MEFNEIDDYAIIALRWIFGVLFIIGGLVGFVLPIIPGFLLVFIGAALLGWKWEKSFIGRWLIKQRQKMKSKKNKTTNL